MKRFNFKFKSLMRVREIQENSSKGLLQKAFSEYQNSLKHKESVQRKLENSLKRRESLSSEELPIVGYQVEQVYIDGLKQKIVYSDYKIEKCIKKLNKQLVKYKEDKRNLEIIKKIKEKHQVEYKKKISKLETRANDDFYCNSLNKNGVNFT